MRCSLWLMFAAIIEDFHHHPNLWWQFQELMSVEAHYAVFPVVNVCSYNRFSPPTHPLATVVRTNVSRIPLWLSLWLAFAVIIEDFHTQPALWWQWQELISVEVQYAAFPVVIACGYNRGFHHQAALCWQWQELKWVAADCACSVGKRYVVYNCQFSTRMTWQCLIK